MPFEQEPTPYEVRQIQRLIGPLSQIRYFLVALDSKVQTEPLSTQIKTTVRALGSTLEALSYVKGFPDTPGFEDQLAMLARIAACFAARLNEHGLPRNAPEYSNYVTFVEAYDPDYAKQIEDRHSVPWLDIPTPPDERFVKDIDRLNGWVRREFQI